jgi:hypothetical protein
MAKLYVCRECSYVFPEELSHLIENNIQVYCERCGSPFILEGVKFRPATTPYIRDKRPYHILPKRNLSSLDSLIQFLNKISFIPLFIFTFISFGLIAEIVSNWESFGLILFDRISHGLAGLFVIIYDRVYISPKVKEKNYNAILLDSFCWGILGCILYGTGVIILLKGIGIIIYVISDTRNTNLKRYDYGLLAKNSLNHFSTKAGLLIILFAIYRIYSDKLYIPTGYRLIVHVPIYLEISLELLVFLGFLIIALIVLIIDSRIKKEIKEKQKFELKDSAKFIALGIFGTMFYAAGIFILLKGILLFFLSFGKPSEEKEFPIVEKPTSYVHPYRVIAHPIRPQEEEIIELKEIEKSAEIQVNKTPEKDEIKIESEKIVVEVPIKEPEVIDKEEKAKREEEYELKLHDSLLPVRDEKDKKLVKEYFSKIFTVLSKDLRKQIIDLKISKKEKNELLEELAFLTKEEQVKYIESIVNLYKEIPKKLINRIRKLPNVRPKHYDRIIEQLKYMDYSEQLKFVQFLEDNA